MKRRRRTREGQKSGGTGEEVQCEQLEPVRVVERELTRPDGTTLTVKVPVYPPFELKKRAPAKPARTGRVRKAS